VPRPRSWVQVVGEIGIMEVKNREPPNAARRGYSWFVTGLPAGLARCYLLACPDGRPQKGTRAASSVFGQIAIQFPGADLCDVVSPFLPFGLDKMAGNVVAKSIRDHRVLFQLIERLVEVVW